MVVLQRNLDCWGETTSAVNSDTRPDADRHRQKHQKRSRRDEDETSSSSSSSSSGRERRKRERKKERKQEKRKAKKEKREKKEKTEKKEKKARKERKAEDRENDTHRQLPTVYAPPPPEVAEEAPPATPESCSLPGAKRPEQAEAERVAGQRIVTVWDPSLGIERSVRANGEVVEQCARASCLSRRPARARARTIIYNIPRPWVLPPSCGGAHGPPRHTVHPQHLCVRSRGPHLGSCSTTRRGMSRRRPGRRGRLALQRLAPRGTRGQVRTRGEISSRRSIRGSVTSRAGGRERGKTPRTNPGFNSHASGSRTRRLV